MYDARKIKLWIGGEYKDASLGEYFDDHNPVDDSLYAIAAKGTEEDIDLAVQVAHKAFQEFSQSPVHVREGILCRAAGLLQRDSDEFVNILIDEIGSPIHKAEFEVFLGTNMLRAAAGMTRQISGKTLPSDVPARFSMSIRKPLGVVASITPFNVPLIKGVRLTANPIACGNTVVHLPSEETPVLAARLAKLYEEAGLPAGVYNMVTGNGYEIGDALTTHPLVGLVTFTGSSRVGKHIQKLCAKNNKRVTLELGGKSPMLILKDADLEKAVEAAVLGMFTYQGQACMASSRIFVERTIYDRFCEQFSEAATKIGMGDLRDSSTVVGPIISERQRDRISTHIADAVDKGATVLTGGNWRSNICEPTILTGVSESMIVFKEETFGPVTSVYPVDCVAEALEKANDTEYGLSASIFTQDISHALSLAQSIESGMVHINSGSVQDEPHVPFGGVGESGWGREGSEEDIEVMTEKKWVTVQL